MGAAGSTQPASSLWGFSPQFGLHIHLLGAAGEQGITGSFVPLPAPPQVLEASLGGSCQGSIWDPRNTAGWEGDLAPPCLPGPIHLEQQSSPLPSQQPGKGLGKLSQGSGFDLWGRAGADVGHRGKRFISRGSICPVRSGAVARSLGLHPIMPAPRPLAFPLPNSFTAQIHPCLLGTHQEWDWNREKGPQSQEPSRRQEFRGIFRGSSAVAQRECPQRNSVGWRTPRAKGFPAGKWVCLWNSLVWHSVGPARPSQVISLLFHLGFYLISAGI